jgi:hypothetical protein
MADLLGAANRVPGYDSANNNRSVTTAPRPNDTQIQNIPDPSRVGRPDGKGEQQAANTPLDSNVPRYDSNLQAFFQRLLQAQELPELLSKSLLLMRGVATTPGLQQGIAQEIAQLLDLFRLDAQGFQNFFMEQVHGSNRFSGALFSLLRQAYAALPGEHVRQSILEFAQRYSDYSSTAHIGKSMVSLLDQMQDYLPKSWQGRLNELLAQLENGLASGTRAENLKLLQGEIIPYLGSYVERTHNLGTLRDMLNLLILNVARYENGAEGPLLQSFRQMEGYGDLLKGLNQLDDKAILKLLQENDFTRAAGSRFADALSTAAARALQGTYGPDVRDAFVEIIRSLLVQESVYLSLNHMLFPVEWNGRMMYSELWVDPDAEEESGKKKENGKIQFLFKMDLESLGFLEISLAARQEQVEMRVYGPETVSNHSALIAEDLREILAAHGFNGKDVRVSKLEKPLALTEVFPNLFEGKQGVNVKV